MTAGEYQWLTKITEIDETLVGAAVVMTKDEKGFCRQVRMALGSVDQAPIRAKEAEAVLQGRTLTAELIDEAARRAAGQVNPRSRAAYRKEMTEVLVRRALIRVMKDLET